MLLEGIDPRNVSRSRRFACASVERVYGPRDVARAIATLLPDDSADEVKAAARRSVPPHREIFLGVARDDNHLLCHR
jgi:hypothetical protein